ncbi:MAG: outer membrane protein assembly factor BamA [Crocinitomicaceae bacterium]|nr:outer membrane protein assembly factor BamA [Crocinitomicaceae bacterium]MDC1384778.1 outer membrane protein assembly factor BamA [Crocinitomicaceae bacterium]|tara:strand:+ start:11256 stop:13916 length:2661 start_codon:yes stop_codon:yes gene_type:complete
MKLTFKLLLTCTLLLSFITQVSAQIPPEDTTSTSPGSLPIANPVQPMDPIIEEVNTMGLDIDFMRPQKYEIGPIRVEGADNYDHNAIKLLAGLRSGQTITLPGEAISKAIKNLWVEDIFSDVEIIATDEIAGVIYMTIKVAPRPKLSRFRFVGINKRDADKIREEITLFSGKTITENLVFATKAKIKGYFRDKGHYSVGVNINRVQDSLMNNSEIFVINVDKGEKVKIGELTFEGNESVKTWKLRMAMKDTKQKAFWRFFKRSKYFESTYKNDKLAMMEKFTKVGLRDAEIKMDTVYLVDSKNLNIKITIDEGEKYYFGDIEWIGNTKFRSSFLDTVLGVKKGDLYNKQLLEMRLFMSEDGRDISSLYMDRGYLFFQVIPVETNVQAHHINYQMRIIEGKEARVKRVIIKGNTKTNDYVIRREIRTKPGDLFNRNDIIRTQRELAQLGYFNEQAFQVNPIPNPQDGTVDIEYVVEEKSSDQIELSGGYGGTGLDGRGRIIGTLGLTFNNFSTKNIFKKGAWTPLPGGDGQRVSLRIQTNGKFYRGYNFSFTEPWLGGKKPNSLTFGANWTLLGNGFAPTNESFSGLRLAGVNIGLGRRKKFPDDWFQAYYELSLQQYFVKNDTRFGLFTDGTANDFAFRYVLQRNSVSSPIYPQGGSNIKFTAKATLPYSIWDGVDDYSALSNQERFKTLEYYKFKLTGEWFFPLTPDKKLVLMPRIGFGFQGAYNYDKGLTPFERFQLGGSGLTGVNQIGGQEIIALRGYEDGSGGLNSDGGDPLIAKYTLELRYPISLNPSATFYVLGFAEAGNTFPTFRDFNPLNVKRAAGVGIRVFLPMFGMLGLDYGWGFDKLDSWSSGFDTIEGGFNNQIDTKGYYTKLNFTIGMNLGEL